MKLKNLIARFTKEEDGAVTVDFVVLTAGVVVVAIALAAFFGDALTTLSESVSEELETWTPGDGFESGGSD